MKRFLCAALAVLCLSFGHGEAGTPKPGAGYRPESRGLSVVSFIPCLTRIGDRIVNCPDVRTVLDVSATPKTPVDQLTAEEFDRRYGKGALKRWKWSYYDNEQKLNIMGGALEWACLHRPDMLGNAPGEYDCRPTDIEREDACAVGDRALVEAWHAADGEGGAPDRCIAVEAPGKACLFRELNTWTQLVEWKCNSACATPAPPVPPTTPPPVTPPPPPSPSPRPKVDPASGLPYCDTLATEPEASWYYRPGTGSTARLDVAVCVRRPT